MELALCLPILLLLVACAIDIAQLGLGQARLWHAAREGARIAAVDPDGSGVRRAVAETGIGHVDLAIAPDPQYRVQGQPVTVVLRRAARARVPFLRPLLESITLRARATFRIEQP